MSSESFPLERDLREKLRDEALHDHIITAVSAARRIHRSMKCNGMTSPGTGALHADMENGCSNDGTGCLCECHDSIIQPPRWEPGLFYRRNADKMAIVYHCVHVWPNGEALMAWGESASCRLTPSRRHEFEIVVDDGSDFHNDFRETT